MSLTISPLRVLNGLPSSPSIVPNGAYSSFTWPFRVQLARSAVRKTWEKCCACRESWVWMCDRFLPYPFQNNIKYLPREVVLECLMGLIEAQKQPFDLARFANFEEFIRGVFGAGMMSFLGVLSSTIGPGWGVPSLPAGRSM